MKCAAGIAWLLASLLLSSVAHAAGTAPSFPHDDGANCSAGNYPLGVDEYGAVQDCTAAGGGGGGALVVEEDDVTVDGAATNLDFIGTDFDVTSSPAGEANVAISAAVARLLNTVLQGITTLPVADSPSTTLEGQIAVDRDFWGAGYDAIEFFNDTDVVQLVAAKGSPTDFQVPAFRHITGPPETFEIVWEDRALLTSNVFTNTQSGESGGNTTWSITALGRAEFAGFVKADTLGTCSLVGCASNMQFGNGGEGYFSFFSDDGFMLLHGGAEMEERASMTKILGAGYGAFWVKNTNPATPWFQDDAGADFQLASLSPPSPGLLVGDCTALPCLDGSSDGGTSITLYEAAGETLTLDAHASINDDVLVRFGRKGGAASTNDWHVAFLNRVAEQNWNGPQKFSADIQFGKLIPITATGEYGDSGTVTHAFETLSGRFVELDGGLSSTARATPGLPSVGMATLYADTDSIWRSIDADGGEAQVTNASMHTKTWPAQDWITDGTQCSDPIETAIPTGGSTKTWAVSCADNDTSIAHGSWFLPNSFVFARFGFSLSAYHPTSEVITCTFDVTCQCFANQAIGDTYTTKTEQTEIVLTTEATADQHVSASQDCVDTTPADGACDATGVGTNAQPTVCAMPAGSCIGGYLMRWELSVDAANSHANCANMKLMHLNALWNNRGEDD